MSWKNRQKKKPDATLVLVLLLLFAFPVLVHHAFEEIKVWLSAGSGAGTRLGQAGPMGGYGGRGGESGRHASEWSPYRLHGESEADSGVYSGGRASLEALARIEREQRERFSGRGATRPRNRLEEGWVYIEPMPSRPSRHFTELPKPMLSSGVALTTSPAEPREPEKLGANTWGQGMPTSEKIAENPWGKGVAVAQPRGENPWGQDTPMPVVYQAPATAPAPEQFRPKAPPRAKPAEPARLERLVQACGRMVPENKVATVSMECAPRPAEGPARKPASEGAGEGGQDPIFLP